MSAHWTCAVHGPASIDCRGCDNELIALTEREHAAEVCMCHGNDRPHSAHLPCDMGCQPDWHRDGCAVYTSVTSPGASS